LPEGRARRQCIRPWDDQGGNAKPSRAYGPRTGLRNGCARRSPENDYRAPRDRDRRRRDCGERRQQVATPAAILDILGAPKIVDRGPRTRFYPRLRRHQRGWPATPARPDARRQPTPGSAILLGNETKRLRPLASRHWRQGGPSIYLVFAEQTPRGAAATREQTRTSGWPTRGSPMTRSSFFDAARTKSYITEPGIPHSIYEIPGARGMRDIEFRSFSKSGGFTGVRWRLCRAARRTLLAKTASGVKRSHCIPLWLRPADDQVSTAVSLHRPSAAPPRLFILPQGKGRKKKKQGAHRALLSRQCAESFGKPANEGRLGLPGAGVNAPYIWVKMPWRPLVPGRCSTRLLHEANVVHHSGPPAFGAAGGKDISAYQAPFKLPPRNAEGSGPAAFLALKV